MSPNYTAEQKINTCWALQTNKHKKYRQLKILWSASNFWAKIKQNKTNELRLNNRHSMTKFKNHLINSQPINLQRVSTFSYTTLSTFTTEEERQHRKYTNLQFLSQPLGVDRQAQHLLLVWRCLLIVSSLLLLFFLWAPQKHQWVTLRHSLTCSIKTHCSLFWLSPTHPHTHTPSCCHKYSQEHQMYIKPRLKIVPTNARFPVFC